MRHKLRKDKALRVPKSTPAQISREIGAADAAEELGIQPETLRIYIRKGCPHRRGRSNTIFVNVAEVQAWAKEHGHTGVPGRPWHLHDSPDMEAARLRKENALAAKYELQTARERGELVPVEAVQRWLIQHHTTARNHLLGLPAKAIVLMQGRDAAEQQSILDELIRESLETISNMGGELEGGLVAS